MENIHKLKTDFNDFDELLKNPNHVVRRYFTMFLNGDYGQEYFNKYSTRYISANTYKQKRSIIIQAFLEFNAIDYGLKPSQVQYWLKKNIGLEKLEQLNAELITDIDNILLEEVA